MVTYCTLLMATQFSFMRYHAMPCHAIQFSEHVIISMLIRNFSHLLTNSWIKLPHVHHITYIPISQFLWLSVKLFLPGAFDVFEFVGSSAFGFPSCKAILPPSYASFAFLPASFRPFVFAPLLRVCLYFSACSSPRTESAHVCIGKHLSQPAHPTSAASGQAKTLLYCG